MNRLLITVPAVLLCAFLSACGGRGGETPKADERPSADAGAETFAPGEPEVDSGSLGGTSSGSKGKDSSGGQQNGKPGIEVAGPTLNDDYPEYFGNVYRDDRSKCAYVYPEAAASYDVRVDSVSVGAPFVLRTDCGPTSNEHSAASGPCRAGIVIPPRESGGCRIGFTFAAGTDFGRNYLTQMTWRLSTMCTDTEHAPCSEPGVVAAGPSAENPVRAVWTQRMAIRFCGGTDYAAEGSDGQETAGTGAAPSTGCTSAKPAEPSDEPTGETTDGPADPEPGAEPGPEAEPEPEATATEGE